jgi:GNAT superfamily N-acetyltransferase
VLLIRPARDADADAIAAQVMEVQAMHVAAHPSIFRPPAAGMFPASRARELMRSPLHVFLVACEGQEIVGHAYAEVQHQEESPFKYASARLHLHQFAVRTERRGAGVGSRLLEALRAEAQARGIAELSLDVWTFNAGARAFYAREGFRPMREWWTLDLGAEPTAGGDGSGE